jgi:hypothetical protein
MRYLRMGIHECLFIRFRVFKNRYSVGSGKQMILGLSLIMDKEN